VGYSSKSKSERKGGIMSNLSDSVVLHYFQGWGQSIGCRIDILNEAVKAAGINAVFNQYEEDGKLIAGWEGKGGERAIQFRRDLDMCFPLGKFEDESAAIEGVIAEYKGGKK
jgi:hypothetical protein